MPFAPSKIRPPRPREGLLLARQALEQALRDALAQTRAVLLCAAAGYGKTATRARPRGPAAPGRCAGLDHARRGRRPGAPARVPDGGAGAVRSTLARRPRGPDRRRARRGRRGLAGDGGRARRYARCLCRRARRHRAGRRASPRDEPGLRFVDLLLLHLGHAAALRSPRVMSRRCVWRAFGPAASCRTFARSSCASARTSRARCSPARASMRLRRRRCIGAVPAGTPACTSHSAVPEMQAPGSRPTPCAGTRC